MTELASENVMEPEGPRSGAWLGQYTARLGQDGMPGALRSFRAALHAIRDRLPLEEVTLLGDCLPVLIRGAFYRGWRATTGPRETGTADLVYQEIAGSLDGSLAVSPHDVMASVFSVIEQRIPWDVVERVRRVLPQPLREMWETAA
jgi:uncharacterized protein (DUF2267 family)